MITANGGTEMGQTSLVQRYVACDLLSFMMNLIIAQSALSYMCFLGLAFWVWASQVLYDIRFRQKDWLHLFFALLQLLTFCALAGFAGGFDIGQGIRPDKDTGIIQQLQEPDEFQYIDQNPNAENLRSQFIARVNGIGIAAVMAFSRVVLLIQYIRGEMSNAYERTGSDSHF